MNHHSPGSDYRALADLNVIDDARTNPYPRSSADVDAAGKVCAGTDVNAIVNDAIMVNRCACIDYHTFADDAASINDRAGSDHGTFSNARI